MKKLLLTSITCLAALGSTSAFADSYEITVTNTLDEELFAPILVTDAGNDIHIFDGDYVTPEAEVQILTGDPAMLAGRIGEGATVGHGMDGPPGVLLAPGKSVTFSFESDSTALRIIAMIAPTVVLDHYVSTVVDLHATDSVSGTFSRFDIGHDEGTMVNGRVATDIGTYEITRIDG